MYVDFRDIPLQASGFPTCGVTAAKYTVYDIMPFFVQVSGLYLLFMACPLSHVVGVLLPLSVRTELLY